MARLVVEALAYDWNYLEDTASNERVGLSVSVSDATTGAPVTGLTKDHFKVERINGANWLQVVEVSSALQKGFYLVEIQGVAASTRQTSSYGVAVSAPAGRGQTLVTVVTTPNT